MQNLNIEMLPDEARKELLKFYEMLLRKYNLKKYDFKKNEDDIKKEILADEIQIDTRGWKFNREEIYER